MINAFKAKIGQTGHDAEDPKDLAVRKANLKNAIVAVLSGKLDRGYRASRGKYPKFIEYIN